MPEGFGVGVSQERNRQSSANLDALFNEIKDAQKRRDQLNKMQAEIEAEDRRAANTAILKGSPTFVTSEGVQSIESLGSDAVAASQAVQKSKIDMEIAREQRKILIEMGAQAVEAGGDISLLNPDVMLQTLSTPQQQALSPQPTQITPQVAQSAGIQAPQAPTPSQATQDKLLPSVSELQLEKEFIGGRRVPGAKERNKARQDEFKVRQDIAKASAKSKEEESRKAKEAVTPEMRFLQQFERSFGELKQFDPNVDKVGFEGLIARGGAKISTLLQNLPETRAFLKELEPRANAMARAIEGGRITDQDRQIYPKSFANAIVEPGETNIRLASNSLINIADKGGNIQPIIDMLVASETPLMQDIAARVVEAHPKFEPDSLQLNADDILGEFE